MIRLKRGLITVVGFNQPLLKKILEFSNFDCSQDFIKSKISSIRLVIICPELTNIRSILSERALSL